MSFIRPRQLHNKSFDLYSNYPFYTPGIGGLFAILIFFLLGALLGNIVTAILTAAISKDFAIEYGMFIAYPVMFIPAMIFAANKSMNNALFDTGYSLDSNHFGKTGGFVMALMMILATLATAFMTDILNYMMPPVPQWLEKLMESLTTGNFWLNLLMVSVMAPIFEEWLCRGEILRGLLHHMSPVWAILISALFFAVIHANPWQAIPAFILGCLFGYVYYKTGSLKLTMLMHCTNNTFALICSNIDSIKDFNSWVEILKPARYWMVWALCAVLLYFILKQVKAVPLEHPYGNSDPVNN